MGIGRLTGWYFSQVRNIFANILLRLHVTPNMVTIAGTALTLVVGICLAGGVVTSGGKGADFPWWSLSHKFFSMAAILMFFCAACDMVDGRLARIGNLSSDFGAFLDSSMDRLSDFFLWTGLAIGYAMLDKPNLTFILLCMIANLNAFLISYTKCRAEDFIEDCSAGFWQRGERFAAVMISALACNPSSMVLLLGVTSTFTWLRRMSFTRRALAGKKPVADPRDGGSFLEKIQLWRYRRMSLPYDIAVIGNILIIIFLRFNVSDWDILRRLMYP